MKHTLQTLRPRIDRLSYLKTGNSIRTAIINEVGRCGISEAVIQDYIDRKNEIHERDVGEPLLIDGVTHSPCDGLDFMGRSIPASRRALDRKEDLAPKIEGLNYFPEDEEVFRKMRERVLGKPKPIPKLEDMVPLPEMTVGEKTIHQVAWLLNMSVENMLSKKRNRNLVEARALVVRLLHERAPITYTFRRLAEILNIADHTTTGSAFRKFDIYVRRNPRVFDAYKALGGKMTKEEALNGTS